MQRKILAHTYRCLNTCLGGASWRRPLVNRLVREVESYGPSPDHRGADAGRAP